MVPAEPAMTPRVRLGELLRARLRELFAPEGSAIDLAVFRVTLAFFLAWNESVFVADAAALLPADARVAPIGVGWLVPLLPVTPALVRGVRAVLWTACLSGGLGLFSRTSFAIASVAASYVMLAPQLTGAVFHDHHLLWLSVVLAASPCGDALSIDAWLARRRGRPLPSRGRAHGAAIRLAWLVFGCVFFFPGLHKLLTSGLAWVTSDNLRNQMWWKWAQRPDAQPSFRIDRYPWLVRFGAGATIAFELSFPFLLFFHRRTRALGVIAALSFHAATEYFMGIRFTVLWVTYGVFVPWEALWRRVRPHRVGSAPPTTPVEIIRSLRPLALVGTPLLAGIVTAGALAIVDGYPFACFPTFAWIVPDHMPELEVALDRDDGTRVVVDRALWRDEGAPRDWAIEWSVIGCYDGLDPRRLESFFRARVAQRPPLAEAIRGADWVELSHVEVSVDPDRRGEVLTREPLLRLAFDDDALVPTH